MSSSFKDQLYKAGLITKKQLRKLNQEEKIERKHTWHQAMCASLYDLCVRRRPSMCHRLE